jgi:hypothetical protein
MWERYTLRRQDCDSATLTSRVAALARPKYRRINGEKPSSVRKLGIGQYERELTKIAHRVCQRFYPKMQVVGLRAGVIVSAAPLGSFRKQLQV